MDAEYDIRDDSLFEANLDGMREAGRRYGLEENARELEALFGPQLTLDDTIDAALRESRMRP